MLMMLSKLNQFFVGNVIGKTYEMTSVYNVTEFVKISTEYSYTTILNKPCKT